MENDRLRLLRKSWFLENVEKLRKKRFLCGIPHFRKLLFFYPENIVLMYATQPRLKSMHGRNTPCNLFRNPLSQFCSRSISVLSFHFEISYSKPQNAELKISTKKSLYCLKTRYVLVWRFPKMILCFQTAVTRGFCVTMIRVWDFQTAERTVELKPHCGTKLKFIQKVFIKRRAAQAGSS